MGVVKGKSEDWGLGSLPSALVAESSETAGSAGPTERDRCSKAITLSIAQCPSADSETPFPVRCDWAQDEASFSLWFLM